MYAEEHYNVPYLTTKLFDVSRPPERQGIAVDHYDVVIATNVLHATADIRRTLRHIKATLHNGGVLLLNEISDHSLCAHLTFGLLEGWWLYRDDELRIPGCPGLYPHNWARVLEEEGFNEAAFPAGAHHHLGQQIICAQSDGIVRQLRTPQPAKLAFTAARASAQLPLSSELQPAKASHVQTVVDVTEQMIRDRIRETLIEKVSLALKVNAGDIDGGDAFSDYGVDSIIGVNLVQTINMALGIQLQTTVLFEFTTLNELSKHIFSEYKNPIARILSTQAQAGIQAHFSPLQPPLQPMAQNPEAMDKAVPLPRTSRRRFTVRPIESVSPINSLAAKREAPRPIGIIGMSGRFRPIGDPGGLLGAFGPGARSDRHCIPLGFVYWLCCRRSLL